MPHILTKSPTKTRPKNTPFQQTSKFPSKTKEMAQISNSFGSLKLTAKSIPVAIGTRGTVGSLIMQEMDYFSRLESNKPPRQLADVVSSTGEYSRSKLEAVITIPGKRKRLRKRLLPRMCSMVEVVERNKPNTASKFTYRNLKADAKRLQT